MVGSLSVGDNSMIIRKRAQIYSAIDPNNPDRALMLLPEQPAVGHAVTVFVNGVADDPQYQISVSGNQVTAMLDIIGSRVFADYVVLDDVDLVSAFEKELGRVRTERLSSTDDGDSGISSTAATDNTLPAEGTV